MQDNISCALITAFERQYDTSWDDPKLRNERLAMRYGWTAAMEAKQCLHQIQEPAAAEQAAWHAGLDEGRAQATGSVSNATSQPAPAAVTATASPTFMTADQGRDWAWNNVREYVGTEGWTVMDSVNFHGFFLYGWNYRGQYELQRTAAVAAVKQELTAAPVAAGEREDMQDMVSKALTTAWQLGQTFWRQADSVRHTQHVKSEQTERDFEALIESTRAALAATPAADAQMRDALEEALELLRLYRALCASDHARHHSKHLKRIDNARAALAATSTALATDRHASVERLSEAARNTLLLDPCKNTPELDAAVAAYLAAPPAAAPVVLPEPWGHLVEGRIFIGRLLPQHVNSMVKSEGFQPIKLFTEQQLRALLATATELPAKADTPDSFREWFAKNYPADTIIVDPDWHAKSIFRMAQAHARLAAPQAQADARDADGEAFRTAARLGLTLRFYGNCAQSGAPGTPSVYEVTTGPDSAEAMRASIDRAAIAAAKEGAQQA